MMTPAEIIWEYGMAQAQASLPSTFTSVAIWPVSQPWHNMRLRQKESRTQQLSWARLGSRESSGRGVGQLGNVGLRDAAPISHDPNFANFRFLSQNKHHDVN
jgi:hypothetical protein